jgi:hypothetical protein
MAREFRRDMETKTKETRSFPLGVIGVTPDALRAAEAPDLVRGLERHASADWGDVCEEDRQENEFALREGLRLFSVYHDRNGVKFWVITEADRSATTVLLPENY